MKKILMVLVVIFALGIAIYLLVPSKNIVKIKKIKIEYLIPENWRLLKQQKISDDVSYISFILATDSTQSVTVVFQENKDIEKADIAEELISSLQTFGDNFTEGVSNTQRYKGLGNSWTVDVIAHILKQIKEDK